MRINLNDGIQFQSNVSIAGTQTTPTQAIAQPQQVILTNLSNITQVNCNMYLFLRLSKKFNKKTLKKNVANF